MGLQCSQRQFRQTQRMRQVMGKQSCCYTCARRTWMQEQVGIKPKTVGCKVSIYRPGYEQGGVAGGVAGKTGSVMLGNSHSPPLRFLGQARIITTAIPWFRIRKPSASLNRLWPDMRRTAVSRTCLPVPAYQPVFAPGLRSSLFCRIVPSGSQTQYYQLST